MSIDHVIVGGGHFIERSGVLIQEFVEKAPDLMGAFQRGTERLQYTQNVTPRITNPSIIPSSIGRPIRLISDGNDNNFVDFTGSDRGTDGGVDRSWGTLEHHNQDDNRLEAFLDRQSELKNEVTQDMLESLGWAAAGRPDLAIEKGAEAVAKQGQIVYESTVDLIERIFGR